MEYFIFVLGVIITLIQIIYLNGNKAIGIAIIISLLFLTGFQVVKTVQKKKEPGKWKLWIFMLLVIAIGSPFLSVASDTYTKKCQQAESYIDDGRYEKAQELLTALQDKYGRRDQITLLKAKNFYKQEQYDDALCECESVTDKGKEYCFMKTLIYSRDLDISFEDTLTYFEESAEAYPEWDYVQLQAGSYEIKAGSYKKAEHYLQNAMALDDENPLTLFYMGILRYVQGENEKALVYFIRSTDCGATDEMNDLMRGIAMTMEFDDGSVEGSEE